MFKKISNFWNSETPGLTAAAFIIGVASLASRLVGVLRDRALASTFGAGDALDAYYAAFRVPDILYNLLILGALSAGFIPIFTEYLEHQDKSEAWRLAENILSVVGSVLVFACLVIALFAPIIVPLTVPGFSSPKLELTVHLARIMSLSPLLLGLSAVMGGILQATRRLIAFAFAPVLYNLGIIFGTSVLAPHWGVEGVAWGVVLGAGLHLFVQALAAMRLGVKRLAWPSLRHKGVRRIIKLMLPRAAGLAVSQFNLVILLVLASSLSVGSVAVFNLANNLQAFPVGIIGVSFALAAFPILSKAAARQDRVTFAASFESAARKITFFMLPAMALFFLSRAQIVRLALGSGAFDWHDTIRTATVLGIFLISLLGQAMVPLLARGFYAWQNTLTPLWIGAVAESVNLLLAFVLRRTYGIVGLAIAFSVTAYVNGLLLFWFLRRQHGPISTGGYLSSALKTVCASTAILALGYPVRQLVGTIFPLRTVWQVALQAGAASLCGLAGFIFVAWSLRSPELHELRVAISRKFFRQVSSVAGVEEAQGV